ncbi:MAG: hypothetical protein M1840_005304 [Geoglossum simile]|nr:MAG: hypothetical protein M1840_005304 [Geoglossum simile]
MSSCYNKHYTIPHNVSPIFTGRDNICQQLHESCLPLGATGTPKIQRRFVLYGPGGSGKTQICLKFAQDYREKFWGIFWINASSSETAEQGFLNIARMCGLREDLNFVKSWLSNSEDSFLLIIDNGDNPLQDISRYFPTGGRGVILLTTRNPECKLHATVGSCEIGPMEPEEAITLLLKAAATGATSRNASRNLARPIVETLGYLALAIIQAGAVIRLKPSMMEDYCCVYSRHRQILPGHQPIQANTDYRHTVHTTWEVSVKAIEEMQKKTACNAIELLQFWSFIHFNAIPETILEEARKNMQGQRLTEWTRSHQLRMLPEEDFLHLAREATTTLSSFSLISINSVNNNHISMHPLVHTWARDRLGEAEQKNYWMLAASTLAMSIPWKCQPLDCEFRRLLLPHIDSCLGSHCNELFSTGEGWEERLEIAAKFAFVYEECGRFLNAAGLWEKVLDASKKMRGEGHRDTLASASCLATAYSHLGRVQEALELREKLLEVSKRMPGDGHPTTLASMSNPVLSYSHLNRRREALELQEKVLDVEGETPGEEHPNTLTTASNPANDYSELGRMREALKLQEKALDMRKEILGEEHPDNLDLMNNLAVSYRDLGRVQEALELREKVLAMRKRALGKEHPGTLASMSNLIISYYHCSRMQEAIDLQKELLDVTKRTLGVEHPNTLLIMDDLAIGCTTAGRLQEALELQEEMLAVRKRMLGKEHPHTIEAMGRLATTYCDHGQIKEAIDLQQEILDVTKRIKMANQIEFSPAIPIPLVFDVQKRILQLRSYLDPNDPQYQPEPQHVNIKAAIELYEQGKIDGHQRIYIRNGQVITREESFKGPNWAWGEGLHYQYAQKFAYGRGPFGPYNHELRMLLRLTADFGGDGTIYGIIAMNDTGSTILTLFDVDMLHPGDIQGYAGWAGPVVVSNADGAIGVYPAIRVQVQPVRDENLPWSEWINEKAIVRPIGPGTPRLSGTGIRDVLPDSDNPPMPTPARRSWTGRYTGGTWYCACSMKAVCFPVKSDTPNKGRSFWRCPRAIGEQCAFFVWVEDEADAKAYLGIPLEPETPTKKSGAAAGKGDESPTMTILSTQWLQPAASTSNSNSNSNSNSSANKSTSNANGTSNNNNNDDGKSGPSTSQLPAGPSDSNAIASAKPVTTPLPPPTRNIFPPTPPSSTSSTSTYSLTPPPEPPASNLAATILDLLYTNNVKLHPEAAADLQEEVARWHEITRARVRRYQRTIEELRGLIQELEVSPPAELAANQVFSFRS